MRATLRDLHPILIHDDANTFGTAGAEMNELAYPWYSEAAMKGSAGFLSVPQSLVNSFRMSLRLRKNTPISSMVSAVESQSTFSHGGA